MRGSGPREAPSRAAGQAEHPAKALATGELANNARQYYGQRVMIAGKVVRPDYDRFERRAGSDVQFRERPVIVADSVKTAGGRELLTAAPQPGQR